MSEIALFLQILGLVLFAAICSGLNISIMSLKLDDLKRRAKLGDTQAERVLPLRQDSHLTLASILLVNVAAVSISSVLLEQYVGGIIAVIVTTLLMVIFGEIIPQVWFVRYALTFCSFFSPLMKLMIFMTYPISRPIQYMLDKMLGHETPYLHSRDELGLLVGEHLGLKKSELDEDEVEIIQGALQLSEKRVREILTPIKKVFSLLPNEKIDNITIDKIKRHNRSRIPVINASYTKCYGVLLMKDLVDIDFDTQSFLPHELMLYTTKNVGSMTALDTMFRHFISARSHLMPVTEDGKIIGIVTIEDLIEEIIGHEILDEADRNRIHA
jgi:metal transporter CNNM